MRNELSALNRLTDFKSNVSAHYFIKRNGKIINLVPDLYELGMQENQIGKIFNL